MQYALFILRDREQRMENDNAQKHMWLGTMNKAAKIPRDIPDEKKEELIRMNFKHANLDLDDIKLNKREYLYVRPNPLVEEQRRVFQESVYEGWFDIPDKLVKHHNKRVQLSAH